MSFYEQEQVVVPRAPTKEELGQAIQQRPVDFNIGNYFKKGWAAFKANVCAFWGTLIVYFLISGLSLFLSWKLYCAKFGKPNINWDNEDFHHRRQHEYEHLYEQLPESFIIWFAATFAIMYFFVWAPMKSSFFRASFVALRTNSKMAFGDAFASFHCPYWCRLLWLTICFTALSAVFGPFSSGLVGFFGMFSYALHADNDHIPLGVWSSVKFSTQAVMRHFCGILGFIVLSIVLNVVGLLTVFGLLITIPVNWFAFCFVYHDVIRINGFPYVASVGLQQVSIQQGVAVAAPVVPHVSVAPGGYTQLQEYNEFQQVEGAC